jgi:uncharacterized membrane protein YkgB
MKHLPRLFDTQLVFWCQKMEEPFARGSIFIVYFWFGILKLLGFSPAEQLVQELYLKTVPFLSFSTFYILFALFEMLIGIVFLKRGWERFAIVLLGLHLITTVMPLFFLPAISWSGFMVPTLVGQYIIKNVLIATAGVVILAKMVPKK